MHRYHRGRTVCVATVVAMFVALAISIQPAAAQVGRSSDDGDLSAHQRAVLSAIARDTWRFFEQDVDPSTHLPLDNLGPGTMRGAYTSSANIGVYLWAVVAARDLGLVSQGQATTLATATLNEVAAPGPGPRLPLPVVRHHHRSGDPGPGQAPATTRGGTNDNCSFLSAVDNGWFASGLIVVRNALPGARDDGDRPARRHGLLDLLRRPRRRRDCNVNPAIAATSRPGRCTAATTRAARPGDGGYHNGAIYSDPRIAMYIGMGLHQMPGDVWWRTWRKLPPPRVRCDTDPDFSWQGQWPVRRLLDDGQRPAVRQAVPRLGRALHLPRHSTASSPPGPAACSRR